MAQSRIISGEILSTGLKMMIKNEKSPASEKLDAVVSNTLISF